MKTRAPGARAISGVKALLREGDFLGALTLLGKSVDRPVRGLLDFNIRFNFDQDLLLSNGHDKPSCDAGGYGSALEILKRVARIEGLGKTARLLEAAVEVCAGKYEEAARLLNRLEALDRGNFWVYLWKFRAGIKADFIAGRTHAMVEGLKDLDRAVLLAPDSVHAYSWRARCFKGLDFVPLAFADVRRAVELDPHYLWAAAVYANMFAELGLRQEAWNGCIALLARCPEDPTGWAVHARIRARWGDYAGAMRDLDRAIELDGKGSFFYSWRGETFRLLGRYGEAERDLRATLDSHPRYHLGLAWMGRLQMHLGRLEEAEESLSAAVREDPSIEMAAKYRWQARLGLGKFQEAVGDFYRYSHMTSDQVWSPTLAWPTPEIFWRKLRQRYAREPWMHAWLGRIQMGSKEPDLKAAFRDVQKALALDSGLGWAHLWKGEILFRMGEDASALREFEEAQRLSPSSWSLGWLGRISLKLGKWDEGLSFIDSSLALNPDDHSLRAARGQALMGLHRFEEALVELNPIYLRINGDADGFGWRANVLAAVKRWSEALENIDLALHAYGGRRKNEDFAALQALRSEVLRAMAQP